MDNPNLTPEGRFKSSKHPDLPDDRVRLNVARRENWEGLLLIADAYADSDPEFANALRLRIAAAAKEQGHEDVQVRTIYVVA